MEWRGFDLGAAEDEPPKTFYGELFGWGLQPAAETYTMVDTRGGAGINGGIGRSGTGDPWCAFYVTVDDLQAALDKAESMGGKTVVPVTEIPDTVTFAMFNDPDGLLVGLVKAPEGDVSAPEPAAGDGAPVDWFEVLGTDAARSQSFYRELFGWSIGGADESYGLVDTRAGYGISGGIGAAQQGSPWATLYASVRDLEVTLAKAEVLGGQRVYGPIDIDDHMQSGAIRDPAGNVFGVYHHAAH